jgi:hypothetical protein
LQEATVPGYTITITPNDGESGAQTTIRVDTASGAPRIVEMTIRASQGNGLSQQQVQALDLDRLISALGASVAEAPAAAAPAAAAPAPASRRGTRGGAAKRTGRKAQTGGGRGRRSRAAQESTAEGRTGRAYRRMPDADEVVAAYKQSGGTTALARHYGVPRHTATGWIRRLRRLGLLEARD